MTNTTTTVLLMTAALSLAAPSRVDAQTAAAGPENYFNLTFGAQPQRRTVDAVATATIFDETAEFTQEQRIGNGAFFDIAVGHRVLPNMLVGFTVSLFGSDGTASGTASIPDPLFVGQPTIVPIEASDLKRSEQGYHLQAVWFSALSQKIDIAVAVGPSIFHVSQEFASGALNETTQTVEYVADEQGGIGFGLNGGVDLTYLLTPKYGIGMLLRYTWGSVGLDAADVTAGGFQAGVGLRLRF